ncbi:hypothetical protein [Microcoleus sp. herbarium2]|uniref:hypothetical protein n=1 Tax=Microcoleus sp. herbarium2 TaxID=3055433 RepID=UPI002FD21E3C
MGGRFIFCTCTGPPAGKTEIRSHFDLLRRKFDRTQAAGRKFDRTSISFPVGWVRSSFGQLFPIPPRTTPHHL